MQEEEVTTHSSIVAWRIPGTEEPGGLQSLGVKKDSETTEWHSHHSQGVRMICFYMHA